jgi:DnaJ-class molecular chaperone
MSPQARRGGGADKADEDRSKCTPCRGTGKVISGLGGSPHEVDCPWCGGSGTFTPGRDAQVKDPSSTEG